MKKMTSLITLAGMAAAASAQISFQEVGRYDVSGEFNGGTANGANPSAVAWNGSDLFVAGFAAGGAANTMDAGIVRYDAAGNATASFGQRSGTPFDRGYSGLDISGGTLVAAYDDGGADAEGITAWTLGGSQIWAKTARGGSGVAFDPGFGGADAGVAWTTFGSGRRALQDASTGADIYTTGNGMIITPDFSGTFWRDMDFASNGDMVARRSNDVVLLNRTGGNAGSASLLVENMENGPFVNGQNVAYVESSVYGDFVIYNERAVSSTGQSAADVLTVVDLSGNEISLTLDGAGFAAGNAYYDFSFDAESQTLAILDFLNREVVIYAVPTPGVLGLAGLAGVAAVRRRR